MTELNVYSGKFIINQIRREEKLYTGKFFESKRAAEAKFQKLD